MSGREYKTTEPDQGDPLWQVLNTMADDDPYALASLCEAIETFEADPRQVSAHDRAAGMKIRPAEGDAAIEVYLVPSLYAAAAALLKVAHPAGAIRFLQIYPRLRGPEEDKPQWDEIMALATAACP